VDRLSKTEDGTVFLVKYSTHYIRVLPWFCKLMACFWFLCSRSI